MKNLNKKNLRTVLVAVLIAAFVGGLLLFFSAWIITGGEIFANHTNPIAGWQKDYGKADQSIVNDCQDYIHKLPPEDKKYIGPMTFFEDGTGQHAVEIEEALNGTWWFHVLIYDKDNKRIKTIKYVSGHSQS